MLSFKNFLLDQDDNIDQEEAVKRYNNYKTDFKKTQISEFFIAHKDEEWFVENFFIMNLNFSFFLFRFKYKYHPDEYPKRREEQRQTIKKRLEIFMDLYNKGYLNDVSVDIENQRGLTRFLDAGMRSTYFVKQDLKDRYSLERAINCELLQSATRETHKFMGKLKSSRMILI